MRQTGFIYIFVLVSGFAGLVYEIVWTRQLTLLFGVSIYAVSAVIAVFLLGLGAGSYLFGRLVDRVDKPLTIFGIIELSIAGYALVFPLISKAIGYLYLALHDNAFSRPEIFLIRFMLTVLLIAVPSILMGGTLPVAAKLCTRSLSQFGHVFAKLYGLNTLGAVLGAGLAGFFLLRWLGISGASHVAILCNGAVGATALLMSSRVSASPSVAKLDFPIKTRKKTRSTRRQDLSLKRNVLAVVFISGFCALGYEVLWTKMLILILGNSSWAFSTVLVVFLVSIAIGSLLVAPVLDRLNGVQLLSLLQILIAITAFFSLVAFRWMMVVKIDVGSAELSHVVLRHFLRALVVMAPPTLLSGAVLPLAAKLSATQSEKTGSQFGLVLAFNTAGSVLGSLAVGYVFISIFGVQNSLILLAVFNGLLGVWLLYIKVSSEGSPSFMKRAAAMLVVLALFLAQSISKPPLSLPLPGHTLRYYKEHTAGIVSIFERQPNKTKVFNLNNINEVTTHESSMITFRLMAYLPYLMHESPREALVITFGAGIVAGSLAQLDLERLDCVEINPNAGIVGKFFAEENHNAIGNPNLNLFIEDGRNFLLTSPRKYDIITADATHPTGADSWILFTKEYYELSREHLKPGGFFLQWLPLHALSEDYYNTILATAGEVFQGLQVWFTGLDVPIGHTLMIATTEPLTVDFERLRTRMQLPAIRNDLAKVGIETPEGLLAHFLADENGLKPLLSNRQLNTDNDAITAFPDALPSPTRWATNLGNLARMRTDPSISNMSGDAARAHEGLLQGAGWLINAALAVNAGDFGTASSWIDRIQSTDVELEKLSSAFSSTAVNVMEGYLAASEAAIAAADTARALLSLENVRTISAIAPQAHLRLSQLYKQLGQLEKAEPTRRESGQEKK